MPDQEITDLLVCGPFTTIDTRTASIYADPKTATILSNSDTHRLEGALCTAYGREPYIEFTGLETPITALATYVLSQQRMFYIAQDSNGNIVYYDTELQTFGSLGNWPPFTESIQSNGILWLNNGRQIFSGPTGPLQVARWQYPMPGSAMYSYAVAPSTVEPFLAPAIYSYAFVQKIAIQNDDTTAYQYTTANGDVSTGQRMDGSAIFPFFVDISHGEHSVQITGIFAGSTDDGYPFTTQVFRYSTNSPAWFFLVELDTNSPYTDTATDASIAGNQQIIPNQDPPATGPGQGQNPIEAHQNRLWVMSIQNTANTNHLPQTQVWYSRTGEPWSFDLINQALLDEDEQTTLKATSPGNTGVPFGDVPTALSALGSSLMVWRRQTTSLVYGVDESTYQSLKIFADLGCIAPLSVVKANGLTWWLSAQGFYSFDGSNVQWISKPIYNLLQSLGPAVQQEAIGSYKDLTVMWSFPSSNLTLRYYIPTQAWDTKPYCSPAMTFQTALPSDQTNTPLSMNQIAAARPSSFWIDFWEAGDTDIGNAITLNFKSQESDTDAGQWEKIYKNVMIEAPLQAGVTADLSIIINGSLYYKWSAIDLSSGQPTKIFNVPNSQGPNAQFPLGASNHGYTCQLAITLYNVANATGPAIIYRAKVGGTVSRAWTVRSPDRPPIPEIPARDT